MDLLARHEKFKIEILYKLNSGRVLDKKVFGGGTMLRLCIYPGLLPDIHGCFIASSNFYIFYHDFAIICVYTA